MNNSRVALTRRSLLAGAACAMAFPPTRSLAQSGAGGASISSDIAGSLAKGVASAAESYVMGKVLASAGIDTSGQGELNAKLDQILQQLVQLEQDVQALHKDMDNQLSQLSYDLATDPVEPLISLNKTLKFYYQSLINETDRSRIDALRNEIRTLLYSQNNLLQAMQTWHDVMCGVNGKTSVIAAWGKAVYAKNSLFGPVAAQSIQKHWQYLDAQQAFTMNYLVEHFNDVNLGHLVPDAMENWRSSRLEQLALLRGMVDTVDIHYSVDIHTRLASSYLTLVKVLPDGVLIDRDTNIMWLLEVRAPVRQDAFWNNRGKDNTSGQSMWAGNNTTRPRGCTLQTSYATRTPAEAWYFLSSAQCDGWRIPTADELITLMRKCGAQVGGNDPDRFQAAMQNKGFSFEPGPVRLWTSSTGVNYGDCPNGRCDPNPHYVAMVEGASWWNPAGSSDDTAMVVSCRNLAPAEADSYYYRAG